MKPDSKSVSLSEQATEWLIRVRENSNDAHTRAEFEQWVLHSLEHRREWEKTLQAWQALGHASNHFARPSSRWSPSKLIGTVAGASVALCLLLLAGPSFLIRMQSDYRTATGQSQSIKLEDGSTVLLAPDSSISLMFKDGKRGVVLLNGEAYFNVVHNEARPFSVKGGGLDIEVLGTAFDVRLGDDSSDIALAQGAVKVSAASMQKTLAPGDALTLDRQTGMAVQSKVDVANIGGWRDGRLHVVNETIGSVVQQIQRYHPAWISIPDRSLAAHRVTGIYDLTSPDEALGALVDPYGGKVRKVSNFIRVVSRL